MCQFQYWRSKVKVNVWRCQQQFVTNLNQKFSAGSFMESPGFIVGFLTMWHVCRCYRSIGRIWYMSCCGTSIFLCLLSELFSSFCSSARKCQLTAGKLQLTLWNLMVSECSLHKVQFPQLKWRIFSAHLTRFEYFSAKIKSSSAQTGSAFSGGLASWWHRWSHQHSYSTLSRVSTEMADGWVYHLRIRSSHPGQLSHAWAKISTGDGYGRR